MLHRGIQVGSSKKEGKGLFASENIKKGEIVWRLDSSEKILTKKEKDNLSPEVQRLAFQYKNGYVVVHDGSEYMNHSCDPNTWWSSDTELSARSNIKKGDEVTYDYSTADVGDWVATWKCNCGAKDCRECITGNDCFFSSFQKKYKGHLPSWVEEYIQNHK